MSATRRHRSVRAILAFVALVAVAPLSGASPADAATAGASAASGGTVDYAAAPGEVNALRASVSGTTVTLTDPGATITARAGCQTVDASTVRCAATALSAALGDGADSATVTGALPAHLDGGADADTLTGGSGGDTIEGGPGADALAGGAGDDRLSGDGPALVAGGGDDRLAGGPGADVLTGDGGRDIADYTATPGANVTFDGRADDGAPGEGDNADAEAVARAAGDPGPTPTPTPLPAPAPAPTFASAPVPVAPLAAPAPAPLPGARVAAIARGLRTPARITAATLRRRGLRVAVTCRPACRVRLDLTPAGRRRPVLVSRAAGAGPGTTTIVLRPRRGTRLPRAGGLALRATFAGGGAIARRVALR